MATVTSPYAKLERIDPLHESSPAGVRWTTNNFAEAIPGVPTPLSWSVWRHAMEYAGWETYRRIGVFSAADIERRRAAGQQVVSIFFGHVAGNVDFMSEGVARMPGYDPGVFEHQLFGLDPDASPWRSTRRRYAAVAAMAPLALARQKRRLLAARRDVETWWRARTAAGASSGDLGEARDRFALVLSFHTFQSQIGGALFERLALVAESAGVPGIERRIVTGTGALEEAALAADLWSLSRGSVSLAGFVARHGFHGPDEGELSSRSWREDPSPVESLAEAYASEHEDRSPAASGARQVAEREHAVAELLDAVGRRRRAMVRMLVRGVLTHVPRREVGKNGFLYAVDVARAAARAIGADLVARDVVAEADDVFYLTFDEVERQLPADARSVVADRRAARARYQAVELPAVWTGNPTPLTAVAVPSGAVITGTPVAPGRVEGRARVVIDPATCTSPVGPDEVLVARTTDPSWVTLFLAAGGLVIDIGGPLSHGAIVARELGVPCVIGIKDGTRRIPDGATIRVDGDTGRVEIVHP